MIINLLELLGVIIILLIIVGNMKNNNLRILLVISTLIVLFSCNSIQKKYKVDVFSCNEIIGDWSVLNNKSVKISFTGDSLSYNLLNESGEKIISIHEKYNCYSNGDSIFINSIDNYFRFLIVKSNSYYIICNYKRFDNIVPQIDEILVLSKKYEDIKRKNECVRKDIVVIPNNFTGICAIAFNQPKGTKVEYDSVGNRIFRLHKERFLESYQVKESIYNVVFDNIEFMYENAEPDKHIQIINKNRLPLKNFNISSDVVYAVNMGFNQVPRKEINRITNTNIEGNILFFKIGKYPSIINNSDSLIFN